MSKFRNKRTNGYASKHEADTAAGLHLFQQAGKISDLKEQVPFVLIPKMGKQRECTYIADFTYTINGDFVVADAKGLKTEVYRIKKKLMKWVHGIDILEL